MKLRLYNPEIFQGSLKLRNYFEGWYFKLVSLDLKEVWSFIPGVSITNDDPHSFIQVINGITGKSEYLRYPLSEFSWQEKYFYIKIGNSVFTENYLDLNIETENIRFSGRIDFTNNVKYPATIFSPGIMGWYSFVPFMECKHGIVSVNHNLKGTLTGNSGAIDFAGGKGYIEKDWGTSFPEAWLWIQCNNFKNADTSFNFSVAKIPWRGKYFIGFIAFLYFKGKFHLFSTYNKSVIAGIDHSNDRISLTLKNHNFILKSVITKKRFGDLKAPVSGVMSRRIKESIDSDISIKLTDNKGKYIYSDEGKRAGLEVIEKIFEYLNT